MNEHSNPERVDLVDKNGVIQEVGILRSEVDSYTDLHLQIVIGVITDSLGRILVQRRALTKKVNPGDIDHVCGAVNSGETPEQAFIRESEEETGLTPTNVKNILQGLNSYNRFRYLCVGNVEGQPIGNPKDVDWVKFYSLDELKDAKASGQMTFVNEFFEDTNLAI